jgi:hypothetical protein
MLTESLLLFKKSRKKTQASCATVSSTSMANKPRSFFSNPNSIQKQSNTTTTITNTHINTENRLDSEAMNTTNTTNNKRTGFSPNLNLLTENLNGLNFNFGGTIRRRFSETYYNSLDHQKRPRLVKKCGELNIHMENVPKHKRRLLSDIFNTILDIKWRWHVVIFVLSFLISWFLFATIWYMIGKSPNFE